MKLDFEDKIAVITGGTAGIGLATAEVLGRCGARVAICGTSRQKLDTALKTLRDKGIDAFGDICNVADSDAMFSFADAVEEHFGGSLSIWINNAGVYPQYKIIDTPEDVWYQTMDVNMKSVYIGGKIAYAKMRKNGGVLLNASSFAAVMPSVGSGVYAATKAAVTSMTKTLAAELAPFGIRVCGYVPGVISTGITIPLIEKNGEDMRKVIVQNRFGTAEEVANAIAFLASDYAGYITGTTLEISGGKYCVQNPSWVRE